MYRLRSLVRLPFMPLNTGYSPSSGNKCYFAACIQLGMAHPAPSMAVIVSLFIKLSPRFSIPEWSNLSRPFPVDWSVYLYSRAHRALFTAA